MSIRESFVEELQIDADIKQQPGRIWLVVLVLTALLVLGAVGYWAWAAGPARRTLSAGRQDGGPPAATASAQDSARPVAVSGGRGFEASGYIVVTRSSIVTPEVGGRIMMFSLEEGDSVQAGQVIARLDDQTVRDTLAVKQSELAAEIASLEENQADRANAKTQLERSERLYGQKFLSESARDNDKLSLARLLAKADYLQSRVEVARRNVQAVQTNLQHFTVRAPIAGVLSKKTAQVGEYISPASYVNAALCTLVDRASLVAEINVSESNIHKVHPGQQVRAVLNGYPDLSFDSKVASVFPTADRQSGSIRVQLKFDHIDERMLPEMGVRATFLPD